MGKFDGHKAYTADECTPLMKVIYFLTTPVS